MVYSIKNSTHIIKPLQCIANILVLVPPYEQLSNKKLIIFRCYSIVLIITTLFSSLFSLYGKANVFYSRAHPTVVVIDIILHLTMTLSIVIAVFRATFCNLKPFYSFVNNFNKADKCIGEILNNDQANESKSKFYIELYCAHFAIATLYTCNAFIWINAVGFLNYCKYIQREFAQYYNIISVMIIYNYSIAIRARIRKLNNFLKNQLTRSFVNLKVSENLYEEEYRKMMTKLRHIFNIVIHLMIKFNKIFGWNIFFLYTTIFGGFLEVINLLIQIFLTENFFRDEYYAIGRAVASLSIVWFVGLIVMGVVVAVTCDMTSKEAQKTATICYNLLLDVPTVSNNIQERILREELILLAQQATHQCPHFSAAGFFRVDYTMLFGLLGTVTSHIIVLIQINK